MPSILSRVRAAWIRAHCRKCALAAQSDFTWNTAPRTPWSPDLIRSTALHRLIFINRVIRGFPTVTITKA